MPTHKKGHQTLKCKIVAYNFSPKGGVEGLLVEVNGATAQIVCPPDLGAELARINPIGKSVDLYVEMEPPSPKGPAAHPVYHLVVGSPSENSCEAPGSQPVVGVVTRLNFARHGEANGVVLDSGDFIHMKPDGMKQVSLKVGDKVNADGTIRPMELGGHVVEAITVNGVQLNGKH